MVEKPDAQKEAVLPFRAESIPAFRMAQLLLVLESALQHEKKLNLERLSVIEFLAANPFLVLPAGSEASNRLRLQGFGRHSIDYASPGQRYVSRRERISSDAAQLVSLGLASISAFDGQRVITITQSGNNAADTLCSVYADAYRQSLQAVLPIVTKLTSKKLREKLEDWLRVDSVLFDLFDAPSADELGAELSSLPLPGALF
ncbi:hypothetical protein [Leucobacter chromiireducens]|uniref:hypothetical protein n=1 Tax=Leucobacter chromiireducens TaxID=283877 RepID=UPI000F63851C|nr:hypothetical protein [Leucobacter chromiireducens]